MRHDEKDGAEADAPKPAGEALPDGVQDVLAQGLAAHLARPVRILELRSKPLDAFSMHPISRLRLTLDDGERLSVIFKRLQPQPDRDVRRTALKYARLLADKGLDAPAIYASVHDDAGGRYWVFLEDVGHMMLSWCEAADWVAAFRWLARMHAAYWGREAALRDLGCLGEHGPDFYRYYARAAEAVVRRHAGAGRVARFEGVMSRWFEPCVAHLSAQPRTLVHGDLSSNNLMVQPGPRIRPIDWEYAAIGIAASDVAKLAAGWGSDRPRFLAAYMEEFARHGPVRLEPEALERNIAYCDIIRVLRVMYWWKGADLASLDGLLDELETAGRRLEDHEAHERAARRIP